ncbi:3 beta-hydroxysteroid dehydrogenase/Delta 5--_4-isomerase [bacterium BMS3Abin04]|nr:3 beta-hydroxysteroid dehydrogenase/Delta 5-->4-isomerase [bacterium BMS3Abin04]
MENKKIAVVTGATGFVGSHLVDLLLKEGFTVKCIVRKTSNLRWLEGKNVEIYDSGLFNKDEIKKILKDADYLYHIAGVVKAKKEEGYFKGNVETTRNLLEVLAEVNKDIERVIVMSSLTACGPAKKDQPCTEESAPHPITTYGRSKAAEEKLVKEFMDRLKITIIRAPAVYGERDTEIYLVFKTYKAGLMTFIGFDKKELSIIHVADLVKGIYLASMSDKAAGEIYFISSEKFYNWDIIGDVIGKAMGKKAIKIRLPHFLVFTVAAAAQFFAMFSSKPATFNLEKARDFVQKYWTCDVSKAVRDFGYHQEVSLEDGMKRTIEWYRREKWL